MTASLPIRPTIVLIAFAMTIIALGMTSGSYGIASGDLLSLLLGQSDDPQALVVAMEFRLPRLLAALGCGALFALSGALLQTVTRNPLADPSLVGVSQGAALGVVALIAFAPEVPFLVRQVSAFVGAILAIALLQALSRGPERGGGSGLILSGIGLSALLSALIATVLTHGELDEAQSALGWMSGSLNAVGWDEAVALGLAAGFALPAAALVARPLAAMRLGDDLATGLGVGTAKSRAVILLLAVAAAATATAAVGPIGYVGLIAPHLARRLATASVGGHLVLSALVGANSVAVADLVARVAIDPVQLPAGLVTALIGVPVFLALLLRRP